MVRKETIDASRTVKQIKSRPNPGGFLSGASNLKITH
jgi:hypothetical protein